MSEITAVLFIDMFNKNCKALLTMYSVQTVDLNVISTLKQHTIFLSIISTLKHHTQPSSASFHVETTHNRLLKQHTTFLSVIASLKQTHPVNVERTYNLLKCHLNVETTYNLLKHHFNVETTYNIFKRHFTVQAKTSWQH
jgi:hypothetical protein